MAVFEASPGCRSHSVCAACFSVGSVTVLRLPETGYHGGGPLSTRYHDYWLCDRCRDELITTLVESKEEVDA